MNIDYYSILNVPINVKINLIKQASSEEIKNAYKNLSLTFHPDKQKLNLRNDATNSFHLIDEAYNILTDPIQRKAYDIMGKEGLELLEDNKLDIKRHNPVSENVELYLARRVFEQYAMKMGTYNSLEMKINLNSLMNEDRFEKLIPSMAISNVSQVPINSRTALSLASFIIFDRKKGAGNLNATLSHQFLHNVNGNINFHIGEDLGIGTTIHISTINDVKIKFSAEKSRLEGNKFVISTNKQITERV